MTKSGDKLDILTNATTRRDADKKIIGVIGIGQDITYVFEHNESKLCNCQTNARLTKTTSHAPVNALLSTWVK